MPTNKTPKDLFSSLNIKADDTLALPIDLNDDDLEDSSLTLDQTGKSPDQIEADGSEEIPDLRPSMPQSKAKMAQGTEDVLINLLEQNDRRALQAISGEGVQMRHAKATPSLKHQYQMACQKNPAIKWYPRLAAILPKEKFYAKRGELHLILTPTQAKQIITPFIKDLNPRLASESPIVAVLLNALDQMNQAISESTTSKLKAQTARKDRQADMEEDLKSEDMDLSDEMSDFDPSVVPEERSPRVDDASPLAGGSVVSKSTPGGGISLQDLANKTIAHYLIEKNLTTPEEILSKLKGEGFTRNRANEILGIVKYIKLNRHQNPSSPLS